MIKLSLITVSFSNVASDTGAFGLLDMINVCELLFSIIATLKTIVFDGFRLKITSLQSVCSSYGVAAPRSEQSDPEALNQLEAGRKNINIL